MRTLTIKLPDALYAEIATAARTRNVPKSEIVRERLSGKTASDEIHPPSLWSRMEDLVIEDDSLPIDLSTNKSHLGAYGTKRSH